MIAQRAQLNSVNVGVIHMVNAQVYEWDERLRRQNLIFNLLIHDRTLGRQIDPASELQQAV
jgi:hypothetical protein